MKKMLLAILSFLMAWSAHTQTDVSFELRHMLGDREFALNSESSNNMGQDFKVTRLEYYISEIILQHDGGQQTMVPDTWLLVNAAAPLKINLGNFPIQSLEAVHFHVGVDQAHNHLDPASYPAGHALAPKFPSMHWGWAAGYRFICYEGFGGKSYNQEFQLHGLGNQNYFRNSVDLAMEARDGKLDIAIVADYSAGLDDIMVNNGVVVHGDNLEAKTMLENFRDHVFSAADLGTFTRAGISEDVITVFPNPAAPGQASVQIKQLPDLDLQIHVYDQAGRRIWNTQFSGGDHLQNLDLNDPGNYFIQLVSGSRTLATRKLVIQ